MNRATGQILAQCGRCGLVQITVSSIAVHFDSAGVAYGHTQCPACRLDMWEELAGNTGNLLIRLGARRVTGPFSQEMLEHRAGPPLTTRDLRRFMRALRRRNPAEEALRFIN